MLQFDWYAATLLTDPAPDEVAAALLIGSGALTLRESPGNYGHPYSLRGEVKDGGTLQVYYGGKQGIHVVGTGAAAPHVASVLRGEYPHQVARADVAQDFDEPGAFDRLWRAVYALTEGRQGKPLVTNTAGDWIRGENGRTLYAGGFTSRLGVKVYEKGIEQALKHPDRTFSRDWVRVEHVVRPKGRGAKLRAATASPAELAAWTPFGAAVLRELAGLDLEATAPTHTPATDPLWWCVKQYGNHLRALLVSEPELTIAEWLVREESRVGVAESA